VILIDGSFLDPAAEQRDLSGCERFVGFPRRHDLLGIGRLDPLDQGAPVRITRNDGGAALAVRDEREFAAVEAESGLAAARVRAMAGVAVLRQDGFDRLVEDQFRRGGAGRSAAAFCPQPPWVRTARAANVKPARRERCMGK
jgi:hypothetical protein